jgi:hypothetical protein
MRWFARGAGSRTRWGASRCFDACFRVVLGVASLLLILFRIVDPPVFYVEPTLTYEGAAQLPIFLPLAAAAGVAFGGFWAMREESGSTFGLRGRQY